MKYLLKVKYVGTNFSGFQFQPSLRTVQGVLTDASKTVFACPCLVTGCSRTDSGVHANEFCATVEAAEGYALADIPCDRIPVAYSSVLPPDVSVFYAAVVPDEFHPRYRPHRKEYIYKIFTSKIRDPFLEPFIWRLPQSIDRNMLDRMQKAASLFCGKHDFASFMAEGSKVTDTVRTVYDCHVSQDGQILTVSVTADGFLYNMVRIMVGTLIDVALGRKEPDDIPKIIQSRARQAAGPTVPPHGLYLNHVYYE